jgi:hypothetical protein
MKKLLLLFLPLLCIVKTHGQEIKGDVDRASIIEQRIEQIAESIESDNVDYTTLFEKLTIYLDFPLNLNTATTEDLYGLGLLDNYQIGRFLDYRDEFGEIFSIYELSYIDGWNASTAQLIDPFVVIEPDPQREKITTKKLLKYGKNEFVFRYQSILEEQEGFSPISEEELEENPNARYLGSSARLYARYRYRYGDRISFGFTMEKDPGEEFFRGTQKQGFDFYSGHLFLKDFGTIKRLAIGDFQAQFGQGLTFWSGLGFNRKSSFALSTAQIGSGIGPYTSINENLFLRGGGTTLNFGDFDFSVFYSGKGIDGNLADLEPDSAFLGEPATIVTSFQQSGFHRTPSELEDKRSIFQQHIGGNISYNTRQFHLGFTAVRMSLDGEIQRNTDTYSQFRFSGNENSAVGIDYMWKFRNLFFFGETTRSQNGAFATVNGLNVNLNPRLSLNLTQRYYARDFQPVASVGFGEGSTVENESGIYFGVEFRPFKKWKLNAYIDQFKFPWLRYQTDAPSSGTDFLAQLDYQPSGNVSFYIRYRDRLRQINSRQEVTAVSPLVDQKRKYLRFHISYRANRRVKFRSRLEFSEYKRGAEPLERGFVLYQDVIYQFAQAPLRLTFRYALFDTDSYDARIYAYENDVLYFFSVPAYSGRGSRVVAMAKYDLGRNIDIWLRWAQFYYTDRETIGSGRDEIFGNTRSEIKAQVRFKF